MSTTLFSYLLQVGLGLVLFYLAYKILFSKETLYKFNRFLVLTMVVLSFVLPLLPWTNLFSFYAVSSPTLQDFAFSLNLEELVVAKNAPTTFSWWKLLLSIYFIGLSLVSLGIGLELLKLKRLSKKGRICQKNKGIKVLCLPKSALAPFSWMSTIFITEADLASPVAEEILLHEKAHIYYKHSWDLLFVNLVLAIQWFNPAAWLFKQELEIVHEYQADAYVLNKGIDAQKYQLLLIKKSVGNYMFNLANSFNHSHLTKRITMMLKKKSSRWASLKLMYMLPLLFMIAFVFGCSNTENSPEMAEKMFEAESVSLQDKRHTTEEAYTRVDIMPEFPGGLKELMQYLNTSIQYPTQAQKDKVEGRVVVQFIVNKDGTITNPKIVRSVDTALDSEVIRVIESMPKWTPGQHKGEPVNVKYTLPVAFHL